MPSIEPIVDLTSTQVRCFQEHGFLRLERITTDEELSWLSTVYEKIVQQKMGYTFVQLPSLIGEHRHKALMTITSPEHYVPALQHSLLYRHARRLVARVLEIEEAQLTSQGRLFYKPAGGAETAWHQDIVYRPDAPPSANVWMPLDAVSDESSCLRFLSGSHRADIRPHRLVGDYWVTDNIDPSSAIACPLPAGGATIHHYRTLHAAGPNTTTAVRRALVVVCQVSKGDHHACP